MNALVYTARAVTDAARASQVVAVKVDGDEHRDVVERFAVNAYPTMILLDPDGREIRRAVGYQGVAAMRDFLSVTPTDNQGEVPSQEASATDVETLWYAFQIAMDDGDYELAEATIQRILAADAQGGIGTVGPEAGMALLRLGQHHREHGAYDLALDRLRLVETVPGLEFIGLMRQGQVLVDQKKYLDAAAVLERALLIEDNEELRAFLQQVKKIARQQGERIEPPSLEAVAERLDTAVADGEVSREHADVMMAVLERENWRLRIRDIEAKVQDGLMSPDVGEQRIADMQVLLDDAERLLEAPPAELPPPLAGEVPPAIIIALSERGEVVWGGKEIGIDGVQPLIARQLERGPTPVIVEPDTQASIGQLTRLIDKALRGGAEQVTVMTSDSAFIVQGAAVPQPAWTTDIVAFDRHLAALTAEGQAPTIEEFERRGRAGIGTEWMVITDGAGGMVDLRPDADSVQHRVNEALKGKKVRWRVTLAADERDMYGVTSLIPDLGFDLSTSFADAAPDEIPHLNLIMLRSPTRAEDAATLKTGDRVILEGTIGDASRNTGFMVTSYTGPVTIYHLDDVGHPVFWLGLTDSIIARDE
jgi:biopolymer transport protein ExbD